MIFLLIGAGALGLMAWAGRAPARAFAARRFARAFLAALAAVRAGRLAAGADDLTDARARALLGVGAAAGRAEIEAAHRRLIRRAHPDAGGPPDLAARLNAARDRLLK